MAMHTLSSPLGAVVQHLEAQALRGVPDRDLLRRFADAGDSAAFRVLVERHGPMVLGVCRRVLRCPHDAEDAFQATFLVLTQHADAIRKADGLASWLHGVARRVATKLRRAQQRRQRREQAVVGPADYPPDELTWAEVKAGLDEELERLPTPYRDVLVLCYLEGLTRDEAARRLRVAVGAVKGRLERGRKLLADRLARRGLTLGAGLFAVALTPGLTSAAVASAARVAAGEALAAVASPVVSTLTHELLKGMAMTKLRLLGAGLLCAIALTVGGIAVQGQTGGPPASKAAADPRDTDEAFIRRVSMDLRGVEPTPAEVHFFLANKDGTKRQTLVDLFVKEREQKRTTTERSLARARLVRDVREGETWSLLSAQRERLTVDALKQQIDATKATITATQNLFDELEAYQKRIGQATPEDAKLVARLRAELKAARDELARLMARYNEKEPPRPGPGSSRDADPEVRRVATRQFQIPVQVEPTRRGGVKELQLFVSADEGKTWRQAATLRPDGDAFRYEAPADGVYWFNVRVVASDGTADPRDVSIVLPTLKVEVRTAEVPNDPPTSEPQAGGPRPR